jgi:hypothetical protein
MSKRLGPFQAGRWVIGQRRRWTRELSLLVGEHGDDREDQSGLFTDLATHEQHPPQSRFAWGAPREGFG